MVCPFKRNKITEIVYDYNGMVKDRKPIKEEIFKQPDTKGHIEYRGHGMNNCCIYFNTENVSIEFDLFYKLS